MRRSHHRTSFDQHEGEDQRDGDGAEDADLVGKNYEHSKS